MFNSTVEEVLGAIEDKIASIENLAKEGKYKEANAASEELKEMQKSLENLQGIHDKTPAPKNPKIEKPVAPKTQDAVEVKFANAARRGFKDEYTGLQESSNEEGGYLVPREIDVRIRKYCEAEFNLGQLVTNKTTRFSSGEYTYQKKGKVRGFVKVPENGEIPVEAAPKYERKSYKIDKYAGIIPATAEEMNDSASNVTNLLIERLGEMSRATVNDMVLTAFADGKKDTSTDTVKYEVVSPKNCDGLTKLVNITLGSAYNAKAKIITNDYGKQILCEMKDANGRPLLQPDPTQPTRQIIAAGALLIEVVTVPKEIMPNVTDNAKNYAPLVVGNLEAAFTIFNRQQMTITSSNSAVAGGLNAFTNDLTLFKATERECICVTDPDAYVYARFDTEIK